MKTLIVYYSYEGSCALVAETLKELLNADIFEIKTEDEKKRGGLAKFVWGGRQVLTHSKPALKPYVFDSDPWDLIILGTPVWAGSPAPAMASFLDKTKISGKRIALFACHAGGIGKALEKLKALLPLNTIAGEIGIVNPRRQGKQELKVKLEAWVKELAGSGHKGATIRP
ncbi:MAG: NAD(P)H-dependent oxidoreductase [Treponema sp.]|jgi:flavodoxin|nr:NAD(P)H-dependent oxidoreductase [Treponema sp.]